MMIKDQRKMFARYRFAARFIDYFLLTLPFVCICLVVLMSFSSIEIDEKGGYWIEFFFVVLYFLFFEPLIIYTFGNTPGKKILGLKYAGNARNISALAYRGSLVFSYGLWFCLPVLFLGGLIRSKIYLEENGMTFWDKKTGIKVVWKNCELSTIVERKAS